MRYGENVIMHNPFLLFVFSVAIIVECGDGHRHTERILEQQQVLLTAMMANRQQLLRISRNVRYIKEKLPEIMFSVGDIPRQSAIHQSIRSLGLGMNHFHVECKNGVSLRDCVKIVPWRNSTGTFSLADAKCGAGWHHVQSPHEATFSLSHSNQSQIMIPFMHTSLDRPEWKWKWFDGDIFLPKRSEWMCQLSAQQLKQDQYRCVLARRRRTMFCLKPIPCQHDTAFACLHDSIRITPIWH